MNILFITDYFYPERNAPAKRTYEHMLNWISKNHQIEVITTVPNYPKGIILNNYKNKLIQTEYINEIKVKRVWSFIYPNKGFYLRIIDHISFLISSFICGMFSKKPEVIIVTSPPLFATISGWLLSKIKQTPFVLEIRDLWPETIVALGLMKNKILINILKYITFKLYKDADAIIVVSESIKNSIIDLNISSEKIHIIPNGITTSDIKPNMTKKNLYKKYNINTESFIVSYIGTLGLAHGLDVVIEAAKKTSNKNLLFLLIGEGENKERLINLKKKSNLINVMFLDSISWQEIINIQQITNINLIHLLPIKFFEHALPSKMFESMYLKKPIIMGVKGFASNLINDHKIGISINPGDSNELLQAIDKFYHEKELIEQCGKRGYEFVIKNYNRDILSLKMLSIIEKLI